MSGTIFLRMTVFPLGISLPYMLCSTLWRWEIYWISISSSVGKNTPEVEYLTQAHHRNKVISISGSERPRKGRKQVAHASRIFWKGIMYEPIGIERRYKTMNCSYSGTRQKSGRPCVHSLQKHDGKLNSSRLTAIISRMNYHPLSRCNIVHWWVRRNGWLHPSVPHPAGWSSGPGEDAWPHSLLFISLNLIPLRSRAAALY